MILKNLVNRLLFNSLNNKKIRTDEENSGAGARL